MTRFVFDFDGVGRRVFSDPVDVLTARTLDEVVPLLQALETRTKRESLYAAGFLSYEAAPAFDSAFRVRAGGRLPLVVFGLFRGYDGDVAPAATPPARVQELAWKLDCRGDEYGRHIERIREEIAAGTAYQVNLTVRQRAKQSVHPLGWYEQLRRSQGAGFHACLEFADFSIVSASPELFFKRSGDDLVVRPMKGTRPRGRWREEDNALAAELVHSAKDRAELLMIVDLERNDLGRVAEFGTVRVEDEERLERYNTVWQLTTTIRGRVRSDCTITDIFGALFPCGSVTGAPKISAMNIIAELERSPREVYCGAIGMIDPSGDSIFNVPIRTAWIDRADRIEYGVGSGVTWDSASAQEFDEVVAKSAVLTTAWPEFELLETMRLTDGVIARREQHLARMRGSAEYFGVRLDDRVEVQLDAAIRAHARGTWRVRLLVDHTGEPRTDVYPLEAAAAEPHRVALATQSVDRRDRFLYHKTTNRTVYEEAARRSDRVFDVLLYNDDGAITEFTRGNVVLQLDGVRVTPPISCGLLPGVFRAELLANGEIEERVVTIAEARSAERVWLINSVREWVEVTLG